MRQLGHHGVMTAQAPDFVTFEGTEYAIAGIDGQGLFDPESVSLATPMISTACWRGHIDYYTVAEGRLRLTSVALGSMATFEGRALEQGMSVAGGQVVPADRSWGAAWQITGWELAVPFTGTLLVGRDFVQETYVHMGFNPAWRFRTVWEFAVDEGVVSAALDRSDAAAAAREAILTGELADPDRAPSTTSWIRRAFSLDLRRSALDDEAGR